MRGYPAITTRGREAKNVSPNDPDVGPPKRNGFYVLQIKENSDKDAGKL